MEPSEQDMQKYPPTNLSLLGRMRSAMDPRGPSSTASAAG